MRVLAAVSAAAAADSTTNRCCFTAGWADVCAGAGECGFLAEETTRIWLCGDLFTQGAAAHPPLTEADILEPSEAFRADLEHFSRTKNAAAMIERVAASRPATLACMHRAAWRGDGG